MNDDTPPEVSDSIATPPPLAIPARLTLQERHEKAVAAHALLRELHRDAQFHGSYSTYKDGRVAYACEVATNATCSLVYYAELAHKLDIAAQLAQVEARA